MLMERMLKLIKVKREEGTAPAQLRLDRYFYLYNLLIRYVTA